MITLKSFPFDSLEVLNEASGRMEGDRVYEAKVFQRYFSKFLTSGVYFGPYKSYGDNSMRVSADGGLNIKVEKGAGLIEGVDFELEVEEVFTLERPASGTRIDRVVVRMDNTLDTRETQLYIKQGTGEEKAILERTNNVYEICLAEIKVKSTSNIEANDVVDTRLDNSLCGIVNSLITIDGKEIYTKFQEYIDMVTDNLVRKDQHVTINGNLVANTITDSNGKMLSTNDFTNEAKNKLEVLENTVINNTLTSSSITEALSANMGRQLQEEKQKKITVGLETPTGRNRWRYLYPIF